MRGNVAVETLRNISLGGSWERTKRAAGRCPRRLSRPRMPVSTQQLRVSEIDPPRTVPEEASLRRRATADLRNRYPTRALKNPSRHSPTARAVTLRPSGGQSTEPTKPSASDTDFGLPTQ